MLSDRLKNSILDFPDFPKKGIVFKDISPVIADPKLFSDLIDKISGYSFFSDSDAIVAIDARGFIFGSAIAKNIKKPLVLARKKNKLPESSLKVNMDWNMVKIHCQFRNLLLNHLINSLLLMIC